MWNVYKIKVEFSILLTIRLQEVRQDFGVIENLPYDPQYASKLKIYSPFDYIQ